MFSYVFDCASVRGLAAACLLALASAAAAASSADATSYANFNRETYSYSTTLSTSQEAARYQEMVLQSTDGSAAAALKAANPGLKVLMYEGIVAADNVTTATVTCTAGPWVVANHPSWLLKDQHGNPILYQNHDLVDVGNSGYQQTCLQNAIATAKKDHFDGIYWDMVNAKLSWTLPSATTVPEYPTDASWQAAMYSMLSYAGSQLHAAGLMNVANIGGSTGFPGLWQQWNAPLDAAEEESWTDGKLGLTQQLPDWPKKLANAAWSEAHHKPVLLHSWNTTQAGNTFGLASMLLIAGGESSYSTSNGCYTNCETWYAPYTTAQQLGAPVGPYTHPESRAFLRWYQHGLVVVNPTTNSIGTFSLGGGTYTGSGLTGASSVSMPATSAYILLASSANTLSAPVDKSGPTISGNVWLGGQLTVSPGSWSGSPSPTYAYQWNRCTTTSRSSCAPIPGATDSTYTVQSADIGRYLAVNVTGVNSAGLATATVQTGQTPAPTFSLVPSPTSRSIGPGQYTWYSISVARLDGFTGSVALSVSGLPSGATATLSPATTSTSSMLNVWTASASPARTYTLTVTGNASGQVTTTTVKLTLT